MSKMSIFGVFLRGYPKLGYMVSLQLSAATRWLNQNVAKDLNYSQHKFQEHH